MKRKIVKIIRILIGQYGFEKIKRYRTNRARHSDLKKAKEYLKYRDTIIEEVKSKDVINVLFFVLNMSMWKYDGLIRLLMKDSKFNILLVSFDMPISDRETSCCQQLLIKEYCEENHIPFTPGFDYKLNKYNDITSFKPDVVVYTQPYNIGYKPWLIDAFKKHSLFVYTPYGAGVTEGQYFYDTYLTNIAWKIFVGTEWERLFYNRCQTIQKNNQVVTGFSTSDRLNKPKSNPWKSNKKRVIWAPHHSIDDKYTFANSCFERICKSMLEIAKMFEDDIEFAFKPHPILKERLIEKWGRDATEGYYRQWDEMPNTFICDGEYADLFAYSDGMIHDSASFVCEYLLTSKPVLYTVNNDFVPPGVNSEFGTICFNMHYKGRDKQDIVGFLQNVILGENDTMKKVRMNFVEQYLLPPGGRTVGQNMMNEFLELLSQE